MAKAQSLKEEMAWVPGVPPIGQGDHVIRPRLLPDNIELFYREDRGSEDVIWQHIDFVTDPVCVLVKTPCNTIAQYNYAFPVDYIDTLVEIRERSNGGKYLHFCKKEKFAAVFWTKQIYRGGGFFQQAHFIWSCERSRPLRSITNKLFFFTTSNQRF